MIVRYAYTSDTISLCRKHYETPPEGLYPLGRIQDSRDDEPCVVCSPLRSGDVPLPLGDRE